MWASFCVSPCSFCTFWLSGFWFYGLRVRLDSSESINFLRPNNLCKIEITSSTVSFPKQLSTNARWMVKAFCIKCNRQAVLLVEVLSTPCFLCGAGLGADHLWGSHWTERGPEVWTDGGHHQFKGHFSQTESRGVVLSGWAFRVDTSVDGQRGKSWLAFGAVADDGGIRFRMS
jgi:hypothetical protein